MIDTHAHLDSARFDADREAVIRRAFEAGVKPILTVGADMASSRAAMALAERYAGIYATVGLHPHDASQVAPADLDALRRWAVGPQVVAIGEIGLDYYWDNSPRDVQRRVFESQLEIALECDKPVVVHIRDKRSQDEAYREALTVLGNWALRRSGDRLGVVHCFSGSVEAAQMALAMGFYLGVDGPVTYPKAQSLRAVVRQVPLARLLLETDCPYLAPQSRRGRRNEPAYLPQIARQVAEVKGVSLAEVVRATTINAQRLFGMTLMNHHLTNLTYPNPCHS